MFKALDKRDGREEVILAQRSESALSRLRALAREEVLVCQECERPVRVKAGEVRAWHFAHRTLENCPLQNESPELLRARAMLYEWLAGKFGAGVTVEQKVEGVWRPADVWVSGLQIGYWLIPSQLKPNGGRRCLERLRGRRCRPNGCFFRGC